MTALKKCQRIQKEFVAQRVTVTDLSNKHFLHESIQQQHPQCVMLPPVPFSAAAEIHATTAGLFNFGMNVDCTLSTVNLGQSCEKVKSRHILFLFTQVHTIS